jgi:hypothetical protein
VKLLTKEIRKKLPVLDPDDETPPELKIATVKFFGGGRGTWYGCEFDGTDTFFGYVVSPLSPDFDEWGYFTLSELEAIRFPPFGQGIERDLFWKPGVIPELQGARDAHA